jgi:hypothetical protein
MRTARSKTTPCGWSLAAGADQSTGAVPSPGGSVPPAAPAEGRCRYRTTDRSRHGSPPPRSHESRSACRSRRSRWCHLRQRPSGCDPEAQSAVDQGYVPNVRHSQPRPRDHSARSRLTSDVPSTLTLATDRPFQGSLPLTRVAHRFRHRRSRPTRQRSIAVFPASSRVAGRPCQLRARSVTCLRTPQLRHGWIKNTAASATRGGRLRHPETPCRAVRSHRRRARDPSFGGRHGVAGRREMCRSGGSHGDGNDVVMSRNSVAIIEARIGRYGALGRAHVATTERAPYRAQRPVRGSLRAVTGRGPALGVAQRQGRVAQTRYTSSRPRTGWPCCCSWRKHSVR